MKNVPIRDVAEADFPAIVELNAHEVHHTSPMDLERLRYLDSLSAFGRSGLNG
jgi:hypothetical protein